MIWAGIAGETLSNRETTRLGTGLFRLTHADSGAAPGWADLSSAVGPDPEVRAIAVDPRRPRVVFVGTQRGVHRSDDGGSSWAPVALPVPYYGVWALAFHPQDPDVMLAGYEPGAVFRSEDGGRTWQRTAFDAHYPPRSAAEPKRVMSLAFDPDRPDLVFGAVEVGGLLRSQDGGRSWHSVDCVGDVDRADVHAVAVASGNVFAATRVGVLRSRDGGDTWQHVAGDWIDVTGLDESAVGHAVEAVSRARFGGNLRLRRCTTAHSGLRLELAVEYPGRDDYGGGFDPRGSGGRRDAEGRMVAAACWHAHAAVIERLQGLGAEVRTLLAAFGGVAGFRALAGAVADVPCRCNVEGAEEDLPFQRGVRRWLMADQYCRSLAVAPDDPRTVYVGAGRGYLSPTGVLWCTRDGGDSWQALDLPPAVASGVFALATHPRVPDDVYAAAKDGQLFVSHDRGATWRAVAMPAAASPVYALGVAPEDA